MLDTSPRRYASIPISVCSTAPAVRLMLVIVSAFEDDGVERTRHELVPVLAVRTLVRDNYSIPDRPGDRSLLRRTHEELVSVGWNYDGREIVEESMVVHPKYGYATAEATMRHHPFAEWAVVACPWDASKDEVHLSGMIADFKATSGQKRAAWKAKRADAGPRDATLADVRAALATA